MEPIHIFYKELPIDENNIFVADIAEKIKKLFEYAVAGLSIIQDIGSALVTETDVDEQKSLINSIQNLVKEIKEPDLDLKISNSEARDLVILFQKSSASDCSYKSDILQFNDQKK